MSQQEHSDRRVVHHATENICTCGAHTGGSCKADAPRCDGGTPFIGEDGSLWMRLSGSLTEIQRADNQRFLANHRRRGR